MEPNKYPFPFMFHIISYSVIMQLNKATGNS